MSDSDSHLARALEAEARAAAATHPRDREQLMELAAEWRVLAKETAALEARAPSSRKTN